MVKSVSSWRVRDSRKKSQGALRFHQWRVGLQQIAPDAPVIAAMSRFICMPYPLFRYCAIHINRESLLSVSWLIQPWQQ
jgi:hypothetical protein